MGGYNPRKAEVVEASMRELTELTENLESQEQVKGQVDQALEVLQEQLAELQ